MPNKSIWTNWQFSELNRRFISTLGSAGLSKWPWTSIRHVSHAERSPQTADLKIERSGTAADFTQESMRYQICKHLNISIIDLVILQHPGCRVARESNKNWCNVIKLSCATNQSRCRIQANWSSSANTTSHVFASSSALNPEIILTD